MKRLANLVTVTCLLVSTAMPVLAADPLDPAGNPLDTDRSTDPGDAVNTQEVTQQAHATFQRGDVFVAVSDGRVQWHLPDGTLNKVLNTGEGGFTTGMAFDDRGHLFLTGFQTNKIYEFDVEGNLVGTFASLNGTTDCQRWGRIGKGGVRPGSSATADGCMSYCGAPTRGCYLLLRGCLCTLIRTLKPVGIYRSRPEPTVTTVLSRNPPDVCRDSGMRYQVSS